MNLVEVAMQKEKILNPDHEVYCSKCNEKYFSPFEKLYISVKGVCYTCEDDNILSENIFNILNSEW